MSAGVGAVRAGRDGVMRALVALCGVFFALPYLLMITASLRPSRAVTDEPLSVFGGGWSFQNYATVLRTNHVFHYYLNSVIVTTAIVAAQVLSGVMAAFALGHLRIPGRKIVLAAVVLSLSVPGPVLLVPNYLTLLHLGVLQTRWALVLPWLASSFGVYFLNEYVESVPVDQLDAARVLRVGIVDRMRRIVLPHAKPAVWAFAAFSFVAWWNEFFWPLIVLNGARFATVPFSIQRWLTVTPGGPPDWGPMMAAGVLALMPLMVLLVLVQRSFVTTLGGTRL